MSKTVVINRNVNSFSDTPDTSEIVVPKKKFVDGFKHTKFIIDNCRETCLVKTLSIKSKTYPKARTFTIR